MSATTTVQKAVSTNKVVPISTLIERSTKELAKALPAHMNAVRLARLAQTVLRSTPDLMQCETKSVLAAIFQCASLGLEPIAGQAWVIPYKVKGVPMAQFQIGVQGWIALFYRHQASVSLRVERVHANDLFQYDLGANTISHVPPPLFGQDRGEVRGYYAIAEMINGGRAFKVMAKSEAMAVGQRFSKTWQNGQFLPGTPWAEHEDAMCEKTVLKRLIKTLPKSIEIQRALQLDETVKREIRADMTEVPPENTIEVAQEEAKTENGNTPTPEKDEWNGPPKDYWDSTEKERPEKTIKKTDLKQAD